MCCCYFHKKQKSIKTVEPGSAVFLDPFYPRPAGRSCPEDGAHLYSISRIAMKEGRSLFLIDILFSFY